MNPKIIHTQYERKKFLSQRKQQKEVLQFGFSQTYASILMMIVVLLLYYVWTLNTNATQGYTIQQLRQTQNELQIKLDRLNVRVAEMSSIDTILDDDIKNIMEEAGSPDYLVIRDDVQYVYKY